MRETPSPGPSDQPVSVGAVILAAGQSLRMSGLDKTFAPLLGRPLILHTLEVFLTCPAIQQTVLVLADSNIEQGRALAQEGVIAGEVSLCLGGPTRQDSARCGLSALGQCEWVVVHDGARPCLDPALLEMAIAQAQEHGNAVAAMPVTDTIKVVDAQGFVSRTPPREELWAVQTPQVFPFSLLKEAYDLGGNEVTDDASLIERLGVKVKLIPGSYENIKVTSQHDLAVAEIILSRRQRPG